MSIYDRLTSVAYPEYDQRETREDKSESKLSSHLPVVTSLMVHTECKAGVSIVMVIIFCLQTFTVFIRQKCH